MSLRYECPACGEEIVVRYLEVGEFAQCPQCRAESAVPEDAEVLEAPSSRASPGPKSPNLPRYRPSERGPGGRAELSNYWFLRALPWFVLVVAAIHIVVMLATIGARSQFGGGSGWVVIFLVWVPIEIAVALGLAQGIWAILELVRNTRAVLPPPADTFE